MDLYLGVSTLISGVVAAVISSLLVPFVIRLSETLGAVDHPGVRKHQATAVPRLGGIAIFAALALSAGGVVLATWFDQVSEVPRGEALSLMLATMLIFLLGLVDDVVGASVIQKLTIQIAAATLLVRAGVVIEVVDFPGIGMVDLGIWGAVLSIVWIVGVTNAINLIDGLDGLAGGVVVIIASSFLVYALLQGRLLTVVFTGAMVGACLGFLRHNWEPARIFMGDSGSLTLGFLLATLSIQSVLKSFAAVAILVPVLALGLPVVDTLLVMMVRFKRNGRSHFIRRVAGMFRPDREHFHHVLQRLVPNRRQIVVSIYTLVFVFCAFSLLVAVTRNQQLGVALLVVQLIVVLGIRGLVARRAALQTSETGAEEAAVGKIASRTLQPADGQHPVRSSVSSGA